MYGASQQSAIKRLRDFPRLQLGNFPTPIEEMPRLRTTLGPGCPRLFIKRDDYSGFGFGGNKIRKLAYVFAKLQSQGVSAVITTGGERSNHARMTAFVCASLGIRCVLVLDRKPQPEGTQELKPASVHFEELLGAEVHITEGIVERNAMAADLANNLRSKGVRVFEIPLGGALPEGALGFVAAMGELAEQQKILELTFDRLYFSSSTAATHAGILIGKSLFGLEGMTTIGITPEPEADEIKKQIRQLVLEARALLDLGSFSTDPKITVSDNFAGEGYCIETDEANAALRLLAATEGILLDPVYTAKAMAGLLNEIRNGTIEETENVLFWHTGGQMTMFYTLK